MKKLLITLFILISFSLFSQEDWHYMSISMGGAIPQGNFASTDSTNTGAGYAQTSFTLSFDVGYYFTPNFGLGGTVAFLNNAVNLPALRDDLIAEIEERYPDIEIPEDAQISFNVGAWNHVNFLVGPQFSLPFGGVAIDLRALAGMSWVFPPPAELYVADENQGLDYRLYWDQKQSVAFAYDFGGGLRFNTRNNYIIRIGIDYSYAKAKFNINDEITLPGETPDNSTREVTQELGTVQAMIGVGYYF